MISNILLGTARFSLGFVYSIAIASAIDPEFRRFLLEGSEKLAAKADELQGKARLQWALELDDFRLHYRRQLNSEISKLPLIDFSGKTARQRSALIGLRDLAKPSPREGLFESILI